MHDAPAAPQHVDRHPVEDNFDCPKCGAHAGAHELLPKVREFLERTHPDRCVDNRKVPTK